MAAVIRIENELLFPNKVGRVFIGKTPNKYMLIDQPGTYQILNGVACFEQVINRQYIETIISAYTGAWLLIQDYENGNRDLKISALTAGFNVDSYNIMSLGGILKLLQNKIRMFSLEVAENSPSS